MNRPLVITLSVVGGLLLIGGGAFAIDRRNKNKKAAQAAKEASDALAAQEVADRDPAKPKSVAPANAAFPLKEGSVGENVEKLQYYLNALKGKPTLKPDGKFGKNTTASLKSVWKAYFPFTTPKSEVSQSEFLLLKKEVDPLLASSVAAGLAIAGMKGTGNASFSGIY